MNLEKNCIVCGNTYYKQVNYSCVRWEARKYCSSKCQSLFWVGKPGRKLGHKVGTSWNKGTKGLMPEPWNKGKGAYAKEKGFGKWMLGRKLSIETRQKQSDSHKRRVAEGKNNFYIDGRTPVNQQIRTSLKYQLWREAVFKRDDYTCQWCKARSGQGKKVYLNADHIKPFSKYPKLRFSINNGRTLCQECHYKRHKK